MLDNHPFYCQNCYIQTSKKRCDLCGAETVHFAHLASICNIPLTGEQTVDGDPCYEGYRVLVKNNTDARENGLHLCRMGAWKRVPDLLSSGERVYVKGGTVNSDSVFVCVPVACGGLLFHAEARTPKTEKVYLPYVCSTCKMRTSLEPVFIATLPTEVKCDKCGGMVEVLAHMEGNSVTLTNYVKKDIDFAHAPQDHPTMIEHSHAYEWNDQYITRRMMKHVRAYIDEGARPGPFLQAVICNDLVNALGKADPENYRNVHAFIGYFYNEAPSQCWGCLDNMRAWIEAKRKVREGVE